MFEKLNGSSLDRRSFLRGSALFAARHWRVRAARVRAAAAAAAAQARRGREEEGRTEGSVRRRQEGRRKKLVDDEGREYRVCPQCAYNMYKQGRMWVCENCGYSYVE